MDTTNKQNYGSIPLNYLSDSNKAASNKSNETDSLLVPTSSSSSSSSSSSASSSNFLSDISLKKKINHPTANIVKQNKFFSIKVIFFILIILISAIIYYIKLYKKYYIERYCELSPPYLYITTKNSKDILKYSIEGGCLLENNVLLNNFLNKDIKKNKRKFKNLKKHNLSNKKDLEVLNFSSLRGMTLLDSYDFESIDSIDRTTTISTSTNSSLLPDTLLLLADANDGITAYSKCNPKNNNKRYYLSTLLQRNFTEGIIHPYGIAYNHKDKLSYISFQNTNRVLCMNMTSESVLPKLIEHHHSLFSSSSSPSVSSSPDYTNASPYCSFKSTHQFPATYKQFKKFLEKFSLIRKTNNISPTSEALLSLYSSSSASPDFYTGTFIQFGEPGYNVEDDSNRGVRDIKFIPFPSPSFPSNSHFAAYSSSSSYFSSKMSNNELWVANKDLQGVLIFSSDTAEFIDFLHVFNPIGLHYVPASSPYAYDGQETDLIYIGSKGKMHRKMQENSNRKLREDPQKKKTKKNSDKNKKNKGKNDNFHDYYDDYPDLSNKFDFEIQYDDDYYFNNIYKDIQNDLYNFSSDPSDLFSSATLPDNPLILQVDVHSRKILKVFTSPLLNHPTGITAYKNHLYIGEQIHNNVLIFSLLSEEEREKKLKEEEEELEKRKENGEDIKKIKRQKFIDNQFLLNKHNNIKGNIEQILLSPC